MQLLDDLLARYGNGAVVTVNPYVADAGETLRWVVAIDGQEITDADVRTRAHRERADVVVMLLVQNDDEIELARWHEDHEHPYSMKAGAVYREHGPAGVVDTIGGLIRRRERTN